MNLCVCLTSIQCGPPGYMTLYVGLEPHLTILISTINPSEIVVICTNLAILGAPHCMVESCLVITQIPDQC